MAKAKKDTPETPEIQSVSYFMKRASSFAWQAYKITILKNGVIREELFGKEDVLEIVRRKITEHMKDEGQVEFMAKKAVKDA